MYAIVNITESNQMRKGTEIVFKLGTFQ